MEGIIIDESWIDSRFPHHIKRLEVSKEMLDVFESLQRSRAQMEDPYEDLKDSRRASNWTIGKLRAMVRYR